MKQHTNRRNLILASVGDVVSDLVYYDRKEDKELPRGAIQAAVGAGEITVDEIVTMFADTLRGLVEPEEG